MNGTCGVIQTYDPVKRRYTVKLDATDRTLALKADNLLQLCKRISVLSETGDEVLYSDGEIIDINDAATMYTVHRTSPKESSSEIPSERALLPNGVIVCIRGLTGAATLNGTWGKVSGYDKESCRYLVQVNSPLVYHIQSYLIQYLTEVMCT